MLIVESMVVGMIGQLAVERKRFDNGDITYRELGKTSYDLARITGLSRYKVVAILDECLERDFIYFTEVPHRPNVTKRVYYITEQGRKKVQSWVELGRYKDCVDWILRCKQAAHKRQIAKDIKRHKIIFGKNSIFNK